MGPMISLAERDRSSDSVSATASSSDAGALVHATTEGRPRQTRARRRRRVRGMVPRDTSTSSYPSLRHPLQRFFEPRHALCWEAGTQRPVRPPTIEQMYEAGHVPQLWPSEPPPDSWYVQPFSVSVFSLDDFVVLELTFAEGGGTLDAACATAAEATAPAASSTNCRLAWASLRARFSSA